MTLMNENNKVTKVNLSDNKSRGDGALSLSIALMNENNKVIEVDLSRNDTGVEGVKSLSTMMK